MPNDASNASDNIDDVRETLSRIFGAVAAVVRDDRTGSDLLLTDLHDSFDDFTQLLAAMSFATLDRLNAALATGVPLSAGESRALAQTLLTEAHRSAMSDAFPVQAAARRLDATRRHDHAEVVAEIEHSRSIASDAELLCGATALLAATVSMWALRSGQSPRCAAAALCLAASVAPTC